MAYRKPESELASLYYVADVLTNTFTSITKVEIPEYETDGWDIYFTGATSISSEVDCAIEVKRCKGEYFPSRYTFSTTAPNNTAFEFVPLDNGDFDIWSQRNIEMNLTGEVPDNMQGKQIYMLNASQNLKDGSQSFSGKYKWKDIQEEKDRKVYVAYLWKNALLIFNPNQLKEAFEGYYWYNTTFVNQANAVHFKEGKGWQRKAAINLSKATHIPISMPEDIYNKIFLPIYNNVNKNQS